VTVTNQREPSFRDQIPRKVATQTFTKTQQCCEQSDFEVDVLEQSDFEVAILQVQEVNESMQLVLNRVFGITL